MPDSWLIIEATFPNPDARSIITQFVKPVIDRFGRNLSTFHFFFEPYLLLRIKADKNFIIQSIQPDVIQRLSALNAVGRSVRVDDSYTERPSYGDGWDVAQRIFELGSKSAILKAESDVGNVTLGPQFNEGKFIHLLLNQSGRSRNQEAHFHLKCVGERLAVEYCGSNIGLVRRKLPQIIADLQNNFFPRIDNLVMGIMAQP